jgi:hypothetical protein
MTGPFIGGPPGTASYKFLDSAGDTLLKTGAGILQGATIGVAGSAGSTVALYDGIDAGGLLITELDATEVRSAPVGVEYSTGLFVVVVGSPALTVSYF